MNFLAGFFNKNINTLFSIFIFTALLSFSMGSQARPVTYHDAQPEVFAIGDLHGDFSAMVNILRAARLINSQNQWIGETRTLVQVGDQLDRGNTEKEILDLFEELIVQADRAGGQVLVLNGNHETMNVQLDFRYITDTGFRQFASYYTGQTDSDVRRLPSNQRGRAVAFKPGGPYARKLAEHNSIVQIGQTVYVHGGITLSHAEYGLDRMNSEISAWMYGDRSAPSAIGGSGPLWNRDYGGDVSSSGCSTLRNTLSRLNAKRLVIAHTRQRSINQACDGMVWRIDVGMASYYGGRLQALKITNDDLIQIVDENGRIIDTGYGDGNGGGGGNCVTPNTPNTPSASNIGASSYTLSWTALTNARQYLVQRWNSNAWQDVGTTSETRMNISGETGTTAYARIIGINACGTRGEPSAWVTVNLNPGGGSGCSTPAQPSGLSASNVGSSSYTLSWNATSAAASYLVQRWNGNAWQDVGTSSSTQYQINGEQSDTAYSRVIAINSCGTAGEPSAWITVNLTSPGGGGGEQCPNGYETFTGTTSSSGTAALVENGYYYTARSAQHAMRNMGDSLSMRLYKWDGSEWDLVQSSSSEWSYSGTEGYYYPYLVGDNNQSYAVCLLRPSS